ncbi:MAG TPA: hypothetical protein DEP84_07370, partial [Chloroflexi bacterium]|nr:hypothetical protein [Chloroflexota bacterium]
TLPTTGGDFNGVLIVVVAGLALAVGGLFTRRVLVR